MKRFKYQNLVNCKCIQKYLNHELISNLVQLKKIMLIYIRCKNIYIILKFSIEY